MTITILGRPDQTANYERYVKSVGARPIGTLHPDAVSSGDALLLPGGGDITPAFFGEYNNGSGGIDTELDILQFQALEYCIRSRKPVLGICKGLQLINVAFGGTIAQHLPTASLHRGAGGDLYHATVIPRDSPLFFVYGESAVVNSAHHQGVKRIGAGLRAIQFCPADNCVEALIHESLPILGLQWHPERIDQNRSGTDGVRILSWFLSWLQRTSSVSPDEGLRRISPA